MNPNDIFMRTTKPFVEQNGNVVNINLSETEQNKKQKGGAYSDNYVYIALSTESANKPPRHNKLSVHQNGGKHDQKHEQKHDQNAVSDTSEYFNRLANKIVNDVSQKGGFNVKTTPASSDSEFFLSSETIRDINSGNTNSNQFGGAKKKTFDFDSLKNHIRKAVELSGGSSDDDEDDDEDSEDKLFEGDDSEDEPEESDDEIIKAMNKASETPEESDSEKVSVVHPEPPFPPVRPPMKPLKGDLVHKSKRSNSKKSKKSKSKSKSKKSRSSKRSNKGKKHSYVNDSESFSLDADSTEYQYSDSVSTPKLMAYRSVNKHNTITGSRYNR